MTYEYYCGRLVVDWPGAPQNMKSQAAATKNKVGLPGFQALQHTRIDERSFPGLRACRKRGTTRTK